MGCGKYGSGPFRHSPPPAQHISLRDHLPVSQSQRLVKAIAKCAGARQRSAGTTLTAHPSPVSNLSRILSYGCHSNKQDLLGHRNDPGFGVRRPGLHPGSCTCWQCDLERILGRAIPWNQSPLLAKGRSLECLVLCGGL